MMSLVVHLTARRSSFILSSWSHKRKRCASHHDWRDGDGATNPSSLIAHLSDDSRTYQMIFGSEVFSMLYFDSFQYLLLKSFYKIFQCQFYCSTGRGGGSGHSSHYLAPYFIRMEQMKKKEPSPKALSAFHCSPDS